MKYKETLYFIAKCLTISLENENKQLIEKQLQYDKTDWDSIVRVSTANYVLPALYCNLKSVDFLKYLPHDLVAYMQYITNLNRERNKQIIKQAKELNKLLLANDIKPIFLKGTGNLLAGIYEDIGERMIGDIDLILSKKDYAKAITVLRDDGYNDVGKYEYYYPASKHYKSLKKENNIASLDIHKELLNGSFSREFNYNFIQQDRQVIKQINVLSYANKLNLSILSNQINDNGHYFKMIPLRNAYDVFLLSKKTNAKNAINKLSKLNHQLNCFLASCHEVFNKIESLEYNKTKKSASYLSVFNSQFDNIRTTKIHHKLIRIYLFLKLRLSILINVILYKDCRIWLIKRLTDKERYKEKLIRLGFKK